MKMILDNPYLTMENLHNTICEYYIRKSDTIPLLFSFFMVKSEEINRCVWELQSQSADCLKSKYLDANYLKWIEESTQENSMDEFGQLLEVQNIIRNGLDKKIFAI